MPLDNKELSTELHKLQTKLNLSEAKVEELKAKGEIKRDSEKFEDKLIGIAFIAGVLLMNFVAPRLIGSFLSNNFSPKIGPVDIMGIVIGIAFWVKGIRK